MANMPIMTNKSNMINMEQVTAMKDTQISKVLENIGQSVADFDSCKCPAVK